MKLYPDNWLSIASAFFRVAFALYVIIGFLLFFAQERLIFMPSRLPLDFKFRFRSVPEERRLEVDGLKIHSLLFKVPDAKGLILYFHGNAGDLSGWGEIAEEIAERTSRNVWIVDYPGYGLSEGKVTSEKQLHDVAATFFREAASLAGGREKVILYGRSIGTGLATKVASENKVQAVILESPYLNLRSVAGEKVPWAPLFLLKYRFQSDEWISQVTAPVLIVHGEIDEVIPVTQGEALSKLAKDVKFEVVPNAHHNDLSVYPDYWSALEDFLAHVK